MLTHPKGHFPHITFHPDDGSTSCQTCGRSLRLASDIELSTDPTKPSLLKAFVTGDEHNRQIVLSKD